MINHEINIEKTPLKEFVNIINNFKGKLFAKLEFYNKIAGSVKDRAALYMVDDAERHGLIKPGGTFIESSAGNTGAAIAAIAKIRGYKCIITAPDKISKEKISHMEGLGAKVILCPTDVPANSEYSYYEQAKKLSDTISNSFYFNQYNNSKNPEAYYNTLGPEIWSQTNGNIDYLIAGIGTGGTISGTGKFLKEKKPKIKIIAVDAVGSIYYDYFHNHEISKPSVYKIEGIGEDFIPGSIDFSIIDHVVQISDKAAFLTAREIFTKEGLFAGGSSGAILTLL